MRVQIGKSHRAASTTARLVRAEAGVTGQSSHCSIALDHPDGRRVNIMFTREDGDALDQLIDALCVLRDRTDVQTRTAVIDAVREVMGSGAGVTAYEAGRVADRAVEILNARRSA